MINLIESNKLKEYNIDVYSDELVFKMLDGLVRVMLDSTFILGKNFLNDVLKTQQKDKIFEWFENNVAGYSRLAAKFLKNYDDATPEMFSYAYDQFSTKDKQYLIDNCNRFPDNLKFDLYTLTNDEKYIPDELKDLFIF